MGRNAAAALTMAAGAWLAGHALAIAPALAETCSRGDFEAVVDQASSSLRELNQTNTPLFQARLRTLKDKRGWSHEQFMREAAPLVRDDRIAELDEKSADLLTKINQGGDGGPKKAPDCALLAELRQSLAALVATQRAKWDYMFAKIEAELAR